MARGRVGGIGRASVVRELETYVLDALPTHIVAEPRGVLPVESWQFFALSSVAPGAAVFTYKTVWHPDRRSFEERADPKAERWRRGEQHDESVSSLRFSRLCRLDMSETVTKWGHESMVHVPTKL